MLTGLARLAGIVGAAGAVALGTSNQALNALSMPAKLVAQGGSSAVGATASGLAQVGGMSVAGSEGLFSQLVMPEARNTIKQFMQDASPASWMS
jgi:hypothetical protein